MKKLLVILLLLSATVYGQSNEKQVPDEMKDWKKYDQPGYSIQYPAEWKLDDNSSGMPSFIIFAPTDSKKDKFKENVNLVIQDLSGKGIDLDEYTRISEGQIGKYFKDGQVIESARIKKDNGEYQKMVYIGGQGMFDLKYLAFFWVIDEKAYVLTFTGEKDKYDSYQQTAGWIMNSFQLK